MFTNICTGLSHILVIMMKSSLYPFLIIKVEIKVDPYDINQRRQKLNTCIEKMISKIDIELKIISNLNETLFYSKVI